MKYKSSSKNQYHFLRDMAVASQYGALPADQRVQVKMPSAVVQALDQTFPNVERSALLTQLALQFLLLHTRFTDRPQLRPLVQEEQHDLDRMWEYLEERDAAEV